MERFQAGRFEHCELLAYHYSRSTSPARAIPYLKTAGDSARQRYANEEAVTLYGQAIGLIEQLDDDRQPDTYRAICESLGAVLELLGRYDAALEAYRKGLTVASDAFQRARFHALCGGAETVPTSYPEALAQCDLAEQELGPAAETPEPQWVSLWLDVQGERMWICTGSTT